MQTQPPHRAACARCAWHLPFGHHEFPKRETEKRKICAFSNSFGHLSPPPALADGGAVPESTPNPTLHVAQRAAQTHLLKFSLPNICRVAKVEAAPCKWRRGRVFGLRESSPGGKTPLLTHHKKDRRGPYTAEGDRFAPHGQGAVLQGHPPASPSRQLPAPAAGCRPEAARLGSPPFPASRSRSSPPPIPAMYTPKPAPAAPASFPGGQPREPPNLPAAPGHGWALRDTGDGSGSSGAVRTAGAGLSAAAGGSGVGRSPPLRPGSSRGPAPPGPPLPAGRCSSGPARRSWGGYRGFGDAGDARGGWRCWGCSGPPGGGGTPGAVLGFGTGGAVRGCFWTGMGFSLGFSQWCCPTGTQRPR